ncbi:HAD family hydrolase [Granulicoccus phenolivorans]|uniref:HAD family hydrolase n=1 Tax=Granulicoccus phenolivorans TaxID=266854 RepID=UPI0003F7AA4F|nr:HAD family phosphatase [Granulicoccus phenolivorans]
MDALIFDLDGTLTDTESIWDEVRRGLAADEGRPWPGEATTAMMGMSTPEWSGYLVDTVGLSGTPEQVAARTIAAMAARYRTHLPTLPGAVSAVRRMAELLPLGLVSSSPRVLITTALATLGITDLFAVTVSTEEVAAGKPAPDGYARACELQGWAPGRTAAVEDSSNGLISAADAGLQVIAVPMAFHPPAPEALARAKVVLGSLEELTEDVLRSLED